MAKPIYDTIGKSYDNTRQADPEIVKKLLELLGPIEKGKYLDLGCGSGNYTGALAAMGLTIEGVDLSLEMLTKAKTKYPNVLFHQGDAKQLAFQDNSFNGAVSILATHHIGDNSKLFHQAYRIIKQGRLVIFTATPEQMQHYWLWHYFPKMMQGSAAIMTSFDKLKATLEQAGFSSIEKYPFFISNQLQDWFLHSGKYRPEIYLDEKVRAGISSFQLFANSAELTQGLKQLKADIDSGEIDKVIAHYASDESDYLFISAEKSVVFIDGFSLM